MLLCSAMSSLCASAALVSFAFTFTGEHPTLARSSLTSSTTWSAALDAADDGEAAALVAGAVVAGALDFTAVGAVADRVVAGAEVVRALGVAEADRDARSDSFARFGDADFSASRWWLF